MSKLLLFYFVFIVHFSSSAQVSDIIAVKKRNGRTIKNFYEGVPALFETKDGEYIEGPIDKIYNDTVYIRMFTIEKMMSSFGSYVYDTLNSYLIRTYYKDIKRISVYKNRGAVRERVGVLMMIAGAGYAFLNIVNGTLFHLPLTDPQNLKTLGISTALFAAGFINNKFFPASSFSSKKDKIVYIKLNK